MLFVCLGSAPNLLTACGSAVDDSSCGGSEVAQSIVNGTQSESYLGLGDEDVAAIVPISSGSLPEGSLCTGVLVGPDWVLTAAHCLAMQGPTVRIPGNEGPVDAQIVDTVAHPKLDAALLRIDTAAPTMGSAAAQPAAVGLVSDYAGLVGQRVELAGYGVTELGLPEGLHFAVETVTELTEEKIRVDGLGLSGACEGDSGGPMLIRGDGGRPAIVGVLTSGSASCVGRDSYIRADLFSEWCNSVTQATSTEAIGCGKVTEQGRCLYGNSLRCSGGLLTAERCAVGDICGWDEQNNAFGCVPVTTDPCKGAGSAGLCSDQATNFCDGGKLRITGCGACGVCHYAPATGMPECV